MAVGRCGFSIKFSIQYRVVQHGVSMYFGPAEKAENRETLAAIGKELVKRTKTPWVSDHLCWGSVDGRYTHDLLPMPYTFRSGSHHHAQKVREVRDFIETPVVVENVSKLCRVSRFRNDRSGKFLNEVVERADCGILLDVNNIYVSSEEPQLRSIYYICG